MPKSVLIMLYTIFRIATGSMSILLFTGAIIASILYGIYAREHYAIFVVIFGTVISSFTGLVLSVSSSEMPCCSLRKFTRSDFWFMIGLVSLMNSMFFWTSGIVAVNYEHQELIPIIVISILHTIVFCVSLYNFIKIESSIVMNNNA